ncbi:DUF1499 domain-containing protein [Parvularcula lutaonensis]|uniref:DUF1499 domain-containing protein n=1 Tax=Parvularcula lutaonensis TaxID=491923 RepID=A0ABV7MED8_9PROT|nr:DUF1499 domain-containing protein [Parvularcula lutaonensis]GGY55212.1 hypothetical protein GCM10007148_26320 [Parvularcula lutaonensis]
MKAWPRFVVLVTLVIALSVLVVIYGYNWGLWGLGAVFGMFRNPIVLGALGIGALGSVAAAGVLLARRSFLAGVAAFAVALTAGGLGYLPIWMKAQAESVPPIHDITTDWVNPPEFVAILPLRADAPNPPEYDGTQTEQQLEAYPDIKPLVMQKPLPEAWEIAMDAVKKEGLRIVAAEPAEGRIEAYATVPLFGFKDDVVIRLRNAHNVATVVDIRSKSRVGRSDLGFNARRIRSLLAEMEKQGGRITMEEDTVPEDDAN